MATTEQFLFLLFLNMIVITIGGVIGYAIVGRPAGFIAGNIFFGILSFAVFPGMLGAI